MPGRECHGFHNKGSTEIERIKPDNRDPESGYSSVVGVLLLITIVMVMGGILTAVVVSSPLPEKVPMAYLALSQSDKNIEVLHKAGDMLTSDSISIVVDGVDRTNEFRTQENSPGWETLKSGNVLPIKVPKNQNLSGSYIVAIQANILWPPQDPKQVQPLVPFQH